MEFYRKYNGMFKYSIKQVKVWNNLWEEIPKPFTFSVGKQDYAIYYNG